MSLKHEPASEPGAVRHAQTALDSLAERQTTQLRARIARATSEQEAAVGKQKEEDDTDITSLTARQPQTQPSTLQPLNPTPYTPNPKAETLAYPAPLPPSTLQPCNPLTTW